MSSSDRIHVLAVEDNDDFADMLKVILTEIHPGQFSFNRVSSLTAGIDRLAQENFDIILLDLTLPDSDGLDTFSRLSNLYPNLPIVVMTALGDKDLALAAVRDGAQDFLVKGETEIKHLVRSLFFSMERHQARLALQQLSHYDELTGLLNRRGFTSAAQAQLKLARRTGWEIALIYADMDRLKKINDTYGHPEGDRAIITVARILKNTFRASDTIGRIGGDEFLILTVNAPTTDLTSMLRRLQEQIQQQNQQETCYGLALSFGLVQFSPHEEIPLEEMISAADKALYAAKRKGMD